MKHIYRADDGQEFDTLDECVKHERLIKVGNEKRARANLEIYLANKSKLKAGILRRDREKLDKSWKEWRELMGRCNSRFAFHDNKLCQAIYDALFHLESDANRFWLDSRYYEEARDMVKKLNNAIHELDNAKKSSIKMNFNPDPELLREARIV